MEIFCYMYYYNSFKLSNKLLKFEKNQMGIGDWGLGIWEM